MTRARRRGILAQSKAVHVEEGERMHPQLNVNEIKCIRMHTYACKNARLSRSLPHNLSEVRADADLGYSRVKMHPILILFS